ncbi:probable aminoacyl tRNA synthase complex-interacting multifunctional protein 2 isoform X1 [Osmia bicornis bicornis]|uniref:probable aminoacyl tRNA synthase complex-interacting multifunctional protein 2 isoform X1 n=1 Tax=Osmia bicornis bicornis TaxID=1437191 RepID=UPI0010F6FC13|nr:probable aminoacyl tRNA synthase complex-interacting multifunctional protein 2 isoform X1 [Osmia bicornis bicornis]
MRNEMTMYTLKPIVSLPQRLHHSKTMYEMQNIHEERSRDNHTVADNKIVPDITEQVINFLKSPLPEYTALEIRQEKILIQLAELKQQVSALSNFLKQTNQVIVTSSSHKAQETITANLIINVNPSRPPYFISALQKIWTDVDIRVQTYTHSSINKTGPITHQLTTTSSRKNVINLSLIWKDVEDLELTLGLRGYHITGEVNFLRYLSRLLNSHNYENSVCLEKVNTIDSILDLCYCLHFKASLKEKQEILSLIADKLAANWIDNKTPDIADIAAWCTIKQVFPKKHPSKLNRWFDTCEKLFV